MRAEVEVWHRYHCKACGFDRVTKNRERIPTHCPTCCYPKDQAGHVYRREPRDGEELDG